MDKAGFFILRSIGFVNFCCSSYLIQDILLSPKRRKSTYHRIMLGMGFSFWINSFFGFFLSSWLMPPGSAYGATGTIATCTMQGFLTLGADLGATLYHVSLVTFNVCEQVLERTSRRIKKKEWMLLYLPFLFSWGIAVAGIFLQLYNPSFYMCWIAPFPMDCKQSFQSGKEDEANCIRGDNAFVYRYAFLYIEVWVTMIYVAIGFSMIYMKLLKQDRKMDTYSFDGERDRTWSRRYAKNAMLYVGAFFLTWIFPTIVRIMQNLKGVDNFNSTKTAMILYVLATIFYPSHGIFTFLVYIRRRYVKYCTKHPDAVISRLSFWIKTTSARSENAPLSTTVSDTVSINTTPCDSGRNGTDYKLPIKQDTS